MLRCRLQVLWTLYLIIYNAFCLRLTELRIEEHTLVGNSTRLECKYDLQGEKLYTVKWYKDGNEFYRFLPGESPEVQVFEVTGVHVDEKQSTAESVVLKSLELASSGKYRCEVSAEAPSFQTVTNHSSMLTVAPPDEGPRISGGQDRYKPGDTVNVNCTSGRSKPAVQLAWYINGEQVNSSYLRGPYTEYVGREGLMVTTLGLKFEAGMQHFRSAATGHQQRNRHDRDMKLKCVATLGTVYWKSKEQSALAHRPRVASGAPVSTADGGLNADEQDADSRADPVHASSDSPSIYIAQSIKTNEISVFVSASLFVVLLR
uniref:Ig-like domain-containing protein n=1 Tax=Sipha flava TaxID=143950 RepID=A0A2S2QIC5_9HEMI